MSITLLSFPLLLSKKYWLCNIGKKGKSEIRGNCIHAFIKIS